MKSDQVVNYHHLYMVLIMAALYFNALVLLYLRHLLNWHVICKIMKNLCVCSVCLCVCLCMCVFACLCMCVGVFVYVCGCKYVHSLCVCLCICV